jgi:hypothetical protein
MNKRIYPVGPSHEKRVSEEKLLYRDFPKYTQSLLYPNKFQRVPSRHINGSFFQGYGRERSA